MILLVLTACIVVIYLVISWRNFMKERKIFNMKGPIPLPVLGNAHIFVVKSTEFLNLLKRLSNKYGDIYLVYYLSLPYVVLSHPKFIEPIVTSSEAITKGKSYDFLKVWLGQGLLTATGDRWRTHRKLLTPAFHFNILQNFFPVFCKNGRILSQKLDVLAQDGPVNLFPVIALAALDNVTEAIMGVSVEAQEKSDSEYVKSIETLTKIMALRMQVPILSNAIFNMLPLKKSQDNALHCLHSQTIKVIRARRNDLNKMNLKQLQGTDDSGLKNKHAFLDLLLLTEINGKKIDEESVREEVDTFMFEGHDTTTSGIVFSLYCISKYPQIQNKIYEEQINIFERDIERHPTFAELSQMKYLEQVIKESLRLYPAVPLIERQITKQTELHGTTLIPGTTVVINIFQMQRHPDLFHEPLEFRPERFESKEGEVKNPFSYLAFSAGPRNCIGQKFAMMEMKVTLSEIIRRFKLNPVEMEPQLCADLIMRSKNGVFVNFTPRK